MAKEKKSWYLKYYWIDNKLDDTAIVSSNYIWYEGKIYYKGEKLDDMSMGHVRKISEEVTEKLVLMIIF